LHLDGCDVVFDACFSEADSEVAALSPAGAPAVLHYPVPLIRVVSDYYYGVASEKL
jgi:hypothetical protein